ncbi:uncharacterized protein G2W53_001863 [Senna tora]|uniref:Uncharacterized protein n=1 Tax=Senna tora TaxID=362788 RepID=A0A834XGK0_9FABA|nr:uncharacterized protein G2W53_001863 [Senna tora]
MAKRAKSSKYKDGLLFTSMLIEINFGGIKDNFS